MTTTPRVGAALTVVLGIAAGTGSALLVSYIREARQPNALPADAQAAPPSEPRVAWPTPPIASGQDEDLRRRVEVLEDARTPTVPPPPSLPPADVAAMRREAVRRHDEAIRAHEREGYDPAWSRSSSQTLQGNLDTLAKDRGLGFKVLDVDCRTTTCVGNLEWGSYGRAVSEWQSVLNHAYDVNCAREVTVGDPPESEGPFVVRVVFDCETSRMEGK